MILHWLLMPIKILGIWLISSFHKFRLSLKHKIKEDIYKIPNIETLRVQYDRCLDWVSAELIQGNAASSYYFCGGNCDHQALRHGSLAWCKRADSITNGLVNYFNEKVEVVRGIKSLKPFQFCEKMPAPPAMPMSIAHGIMSAKSDNIKLDLKLLVNFLYLVDEEIKNDFRRGDVSVVPRWDSTGFDAIYALSLLYTAYSLTANDRYIKVVNKILWGRGYIFLLLAPLTYISDSKRNSFIDHIALFGLRAAYHGCNSYFNKKVLQHAIKFINSQSYTQTNPYFCALAHECQALPEDQRKLVLHVHANTNALEICEFKEMEYTGENPADWSTQRADEFVFDDLRSKGKDIGKNVTRIVGLNGLCLAKSLAVLLGEKI